MTTAVAYKNPMPRKNTFDLATIRKKLDLTREELAVKLGVSRDTIGRWERGEFPVSRRARREIEHWLRKLRTTHP